MSENIQASVASDAQKPSADIQIILSKSYSLFFFAFVAGLILDIFLRIKINLEYIDVLGFFLVFLASLVIYWAQTVNKTRKYFKDGTRNFAYGPYAFSRHPTYLSIFIMMLGAGFMMNSVVMVFVAIVSFVVAIYTFMDKEEKRHLKKYGDLYLNYTKKVRKII